MYKLLPIVFTIILFFSSHLYAEHEDAKELFNDAACMSCHNNEDFKPSKQTSNFKKLHKAVDACRFANSVEWFDDESTQVTEYLNDTYYKFDTQK